MSLNLKLIFLSFVIVFLDYKGWLRPFDDRLISLASPLEYSLSSAARTLVAEASFWQGFRGLKAENRRLKESLLDLESRLLSFKEVERENALLRDQLKVRSVLKGPGSALARVVGRTTTATAALVIVDQGSESGVQKGDLAVYKSFVFGRVVSVSRRFSKIQLLTDPGAYFDGVDIDSHDAKGEVRGNFKTALKLSKVLPTETVNVGDTITDAQSGYILGKVVQVEALGAGILRSALLAVPYEIDKVEKVFISLNLEK